MHLINTVDTVFVISPLAEILHLLQSYLLPLPALVFHYEFWVVVEHGVLAVGQWCKVRKHSPGMDVSWCAAHEPVGLLYHGSHIQVVTMVEKILKGKATREMREHFMEEERQKRLLTMGLTLFSEKKVVTSKSCFWEQSSRGSRQQVM